MRNILIAVLVVIVVLAAALGVFIVTFDINKYKPLIISKIEEMTGSKAKIEKISLGWKGNLALTIDGFELAEKATAGGVADLSLRKGSLSVELLPLLGKKIKINSFSLDGSRLNIVRTPDQKIAIKGYNPPASAKEAGKTSGETGKPAAEVPPVDLNVKSFSLSDAEINFTDSSAKPPMSLSVKKLDINITDVSKDGPMKIDSSMAVFGEEKNISLKGSVDGVFDNKPELTGFTAGLDLDKIDIKRLIAAAPGIASIGLGEGLKGKLDLNIKDLSLDNGKVGKLDAGLKLTGGRVPLKSLRSPVENIELSASALDDSVKADKFSLELGGAKIKGSGGVKGIYAAKDLDMDVAFGIPEISSFLEKSFGTKTKLDGKTELSFKGTAKGLDWPAISKSLTGQGKFSLDNGVLLDVNILKQAIEKLEAIPGIGAAIQANLPEAIKAKLNENYTLLKPIQKDFIINNGIVEMKGLKITTDFLSIDTDIRVSLDGSAEGKGILGFMPALTEAILQPQSQLAILKNSRGMIEFPVKYTMKNGIFTLLPDLDFIAKKFTLEKGKELVTGLLSSLSKGSGQYTSGGTAQTTGAYTGQADTVANTEKAIKDLLGGFGAKK
ncbi:MAG: AsmA family protein [Candidatus Omnitrophica bacterium]|nr:AsmA family protein [Candidatus Omnitrophota bacterium]